MKSREAAGYSYEAAEASFELLARRTLEKVPRYFTVDSFRVMVERRHNARGKLVTVSEATVKVFVNGDNEPLWSVGEGNGPVNALDTALRKDLGRYQKHIEGVELVDYKVRILTGGTEAVTRVLVESHDTTTGERWFTVGVSPNIIDASFEALLDSINYKLMKDNAEAGVTCRAHPDQRTPPISRFTHGTSDEQQQRRHADERGLLQEEASKAQRVARREGAAQHARELVAPGRRQEPHAEDEADEAHGGELRHGAEAHRAHEQLADRLQEEQPDEPQGAHTPLGGEQSCGHHQQERQPEEEQAEDELHRARGLAAAEPHPDPGEQRRERDHEQRVQRLKPGRRE